MSQLAKEAAEVRFLVACFDMRVPGVSEQVVTKALGQYAAHAMSASDITGVLRRELTRWMERFSSPRRHEDRQDQTAFESQSAPAFRAMFRRVDELRARAKKDPAHRREIEDHISAEEAAVYGASRRLDELTRVVHENPVADQDDEDWEEEDWDETDIESAHEPVPDELHIGRRGPTVSGGLPTLGRRRR